MRIPECLLAGSALLFVLPAPARADVMEVTYSIVPRIVILGDSGNPSTHATGRLSLRYAASSSVPASATGSGCTAVPGAATLVGGQLGVTTTGYYPPTGMAFSAARLGLRLAFGPGAGSLSSPGGDLLLPALRVLWTSTNHCVGLGYGPLCSPTASSVVYSGSGSAAFGWTAPAHGTGSGLDPSALVGLTIPLHSILAIHVVGASEIARHFLPEPDHETGLALGAALLVALVARRRRRRALPSGRCAGSPSLSQPSASA